MSRPPPPGIIEEYRTAGIKALARRHKADFTTVSRWIRDSGGTIRSAGMFVTTWDRRAAALKGMACRH